MMRAPWVLVFGTLLVLAGCGDEKAPPAQAPQQSGSAADPAQQEKEGYTTAVQKELDEIKLGIEALKADAKTAGAESKAKLNEQVAMLDQKWQAAEKQFQELKTASGEAWRDMRAGMDSALSELRQTFSNAKQSA
jgi:hypothetical protein